MIGREEGFWIASDGVRGEEKQTKRAEKAADAKGDDLNKSKMKWKTARTSTFAKDFE